MKQDIRLLVGRVVVIFVFQYVIGDFIFVDGSFWINDEDETVDKQEASLDIFVADVFANNEVLFGEIDDG